MMTSQARLKDNAHLLAVSANGKQTYANLMSKPLCLNVSSNPHLLRLAEEAINTSKLDGPRVQIEYDMGHPIGRSDLVETTDADVVFYARQSKTAGFTRFVKNRQSTPTQSITVSLIRDEEGEYEVTNIWIGKSFPATPDHADATSKSAGYWLNHAVVYNGQPIVSSTLTKTSPY